MDLRHNGHKLLYHLPRVVRWQKGERIPPLHVELGTGPKCNSGCVYCFTSFQQKKAGRLMDRQTLLHVMEACGRGQVRSVAILGDGEPTLHPDLAEAVALGAQQGLDIGMGSNGILLDEALARRLLPHLVWIRFTVSAATAETYQKVHQGQPGEFEQVIDNMRRAVEIKRQEGLAVTIGSQTILTPENLPEVVVAAQLNRSLGVDYLALKQASLSPQNAFHIDYETYEAAKPLLEEAESFGTEQFKVMVSWNKLLSHGKKGYGKCRGWMFLWHVVGSGDVYPCSELVGREEYHLGNLGRQSVQEILESDQYGRVAEAMDTLLNMDEECAVCCRHDAINAFLWELEQRPEHINFI
ncbi:MAG: radical SAM protein [Magnetococcales bacterium]|nr:radical SAM protein [Magnetococcales bacterium]